MYRLPIFWCALVTLAVLVGDAWIIALVILLALCLSRRKLVLCLFCFISLPVLYNYQDSYKENLFTKPDLPFVGEVTRERITTFNKQLTVANSDNKTILVNTDKYSDIAVGSLISVTGELEMLTLEDEFATHHIANGIGWRIPLAENLEKLSVKDNPTNDCKYFERVFAYEFGQFLCGITIGEYHLDQSSEELFKNLGVTHVLSVSGYNVSVIVGIIFALSGRFGRRKLYLATPFILLAYLQIVGVENIPALRAVVMAIVVILATATGRSGSIWLALLYTNVIFFLHNPLIYLSVSWQLSITALLGILLLTDKIKEMFNFIPQIIASEFSVSLAASIATAPVILTTFGELLLIAPIANLFISPVIPYSMFLAAATFLTSIFPNLQLVFLVVGEFMWQILLFMLNFILKYQHEVLISFIILMVVCYIKVKLSKKLSYE